MFLGRQRHDRAVALGLAAALLGSLVLGLLVTLAAARGSGGGAGASAPVSTPRTTPSPAQTLTAGRGAEQHEDAGDDGPLGIHPGLLVASLVGVVLLVGTGLVVQVGARRRAERGDDPEAPYGEPWDGRWDET
ncbi:hypothetical protein [Lapillicoccus jejuensis]|uniref:Uncharacterized protein n=1 Tax=Lapillicoccus jejuensis TaxID=402171 RepID=A0A542DVL6_9MICO|nr:hypothetical protein [Lapillicoccus jejuensis]TQJ07142.1 hypothetical protein FB458_0193 [Lapillicoccus jejuensis]